MKDLSVIIPMYNVSKYLNKCVDSVCIQNFDSEAIEIIMVNDESPDNSLQVAEELAKKHPFIKIISQQNKGLGGARNTGINNAQGRYLLFLDADDWFLPNRIKELIKIADKDQLDILEFGAQIVAEDDTVINTLSADSLGEVYDGVNYYWNIAYGGSACNKLYALDFLKNNQLFFLEKIYGEDFEFNTRAFYFAKRVKAINNVCTAFLQSSDSITRNNDKSKKDKYLNDFHIILKNINTFHNKITGVPNNQVDSFFKERLTLVNINAFYLMYSNKYSFKEMNNFKSKLKGSGVYSVNYPVMNKRKDWFRKVLLKNFNLFRFTQPIKNLY
ncbi:glycosyltransferase [Tamlana haliotis]|uniref:Glycosyltransferase n=1 Tax=Pseudotamlana haliotis TaxID=2614804 RepID=A0A6N6MJF1_9FLAO|nr:glycosyltransferase [Tamlana haliotis]KAB1071272.1 glycosyltransferase [Tamlana haliotis]